MGDYSRPEEYTYRSLTNRFAHQDLFGQFYINSFPKSATIGISNSVYIIKEYRNKGLGTKQHKYRLKKAKELGFQILIAIVRSSNKVEKKLLKKFKWYKLYEYYDRVKKTNIELWLKDL